MQHDEVIWQAIRHNHCSFMTKLTTGNFCRNPYNVTGICNRSSCPLANSRYATIRDHEGVFYLYMKTIERAHMPNKLWERVKLPRNYEKALEMIDKHLIYWPKFLQHKIKQRLTKMTQMRIRMGKLSLKTREKIITTPRKEKKRESRKEEKAHKAALLEKSIEKELIERLRSGIYETLYPAVEVLETDIEDEQEEPEIEYIEAPEDLEDEDDIEDFCGLGINKFDEDEVSVEDDYEEENTIVIDRKRPRKDSARALKKYANDMNNDKFKKKGKVLVEFEHEDMDEWQKTFL